MTRVIDWKGADTPKGTSLKDVFEKNNMEDVTCTLVVNKDKRLRQLVPQEDFIDTEVEDGDMIVPVQSDLVDGGNLFERSIEREMPMMVDFFHQLDVNMANLHAEINPTGWIRFCNFPLPEHTKVAGRSRPFYHNSEDILIVLNHYPQKPPLGFFFREDSPNRALIEQVFVEHVYDELLIGSEDDQRQIRELKELGWRWVCYHFEENWKYDRLNVAKGDSLAKYIQFVHARLGGA